MIPLVELAPGYRVSRFIAGGWQWSAGHSERPVDDGNAFALWDRLVDLGVDTFDCADIYTGVESLIGRYLTWRRERGQSMPRVHTKLVPDLASLATIDRNGLTAIVDRSLRRLGVERLDLVQFHWWDYRIRRYLDAFGWLDEIRRDGKIRLLGLTNVDQPRLAEFLATGIPIATLQLQYSVLDQRPARGMTRLARANDIGLLCYGALAGGFLGATWLDRPAPDVAENRSLTKYRLVIDDGGGWAWFQRVLRALAEVGERHGVKPAAVALGWVLLQEAVAAAIVGIRDPWHLETLETAATLSLSADDLAVIETATGTAPGPPGDVYDVERTPGGRHAAIMRYDLNARAEV